MVQKNPRNKSKEGQALLLVVMLLATVITVVMTVAFKSTTDTQITKLEQESQKGLAAAEAGIEQALSSRATGGEPISITGIPGFTGQATIQTQPSSDEFASPLLQKNQQYTFYLATYDPVRDQAHQESFYAPFYGGLNEGRIALYYASENAQTCSSISLEITIISGPRNAMTVTRYVADPGSKFAVNSPAGTDLGGTPGDYTIDHQQGFKCLTGEINFSGVANARLMIVRPFYEGTRIAIKSLVGSLPSQGKVITSDVSSTGGNVRKKVQLFQSYPQIPSDFFVTQF